MRNIKRKKVKERESLEDFDHMLDMVGRGIQLVVDIADAPRPLPMTMTWHFFFNGLYGARKINHLSVPTICHMVLNRLRL